MLPTSFIERMQSLLGDAFPAYLAAMSEPPSRALHLNTAKASTEALAPIKHALSPIPYAYDGFYVDSSEKLGNHPLHHAGVFYLQEPSAMMPVAAAQIKRGVRVLDLCASPGGKSTQLANRIGEEGLLVSNEIVSARCATLAGNMERMGIRNAVVTNTDAKTLGEAFPAYFDVILADAPCSGEGMFRKMPEAADEWTSALPVSCAERQRDILSQILPALRPGGLLIYSTCTFSPEENEEIVSYLLKTHPELSLEAPTPEVISATEPSPSSLCKDGCDPTLMRRFYPHVARGEGQFCALLRHGGSPASALPRARERVRERREQLSREEQALLSAFLDDTLRDAPPYSLSPFKGSAVLSPAPALPLDARFIYACGVTVGNVQKGRVIPHHAFFSAYGHLFRRKLELSLDDPRLSAYLHGDTVPCDLPAGYAVVTVCGAPIGGIKVSGGVAKNHYPKGLRRL